MSFIHRIPLLTLALFLGWGPTLASTGGVSAVYDLDGNRTRKTAGGVTTHYLVATVNPTGWLQSLSGSSEGSCGEEFWRWARRGGRSIPAVGCDGRANAAHRQKGRRPEGFRGNGPLASLLVGHSPMKGMLPPRASPSGRFRENRTPRSFRIGSRVVGEHTGTNPGTLNRRYTYGADLISQSRWTGSAWETHFFLTDGLGSTRALLNSSGGISDTYTHDAFGNQIASTGTTPNNYRYTGEQWDAELGMYYLRARYMSPAMGRLWSRDTFEGHPTDPLRLHRHLYASANPVNRIDPSGHESLLSLSVATSLGSWIRFGYDTSVGAAGMAIQRTIFGVQAGKTAEAIVAEYVAEWPFRRDTAEAQAMRGGIGIAY